MIVTSCGCDSKSRRKSNDLKSIILGSRIKSKDGYYAKCIEYKRLQHIIIQYEDDGSIANTSGNNFLNGNFVKYKTKYKVGDKIGHLTIIGSETKKYKSNQTYIIWLCRCDCGSNTVVKKTTGELSNNIGLNCGCEAIVKDLTGMKFGRLTVKKFMGYINYHNHSSNTSLWLCQCECGKYVVRHRDYLNKTGKKNCGECGLTRTKPFSERILEAILDQLGIEYITQFGSTNAEWCDKYRYDFFIPKLKIIIEVHGSIHYLDKDINGKTIDNNDEIKYNLALQNGIDADRYIVVECPRADLVSIRKGICTNALFKKWFDINLIDFNQCFVIANTDIEMEIIKRWNETEETTTDIGNRFHLSKDTVRNYLVKGTQDGLCNYSGEEGRRRGLLKEGVGINECCSYEGTTSS